jgi:hypothetical protein
VRLGVIVVLHLEELAARRCARESCGRIVVVCFGVWRID